MEALAVSAASGVPAAAALGQRSTVWLASSLHLHLSLSSRPGTLSSGTADDVFRKHLSLLPARSKGPSGIGGEIAAGYIPGQRLG